MKFWTCPECGATNSAGMEQCGCGYTPRRMIQQVPEPHPELSGHKGSLISFRWYDRLVAAGIVTMQQAADGILSGKTAIALGVYSGRGINPVAAGHYANLVDMLVAAGYDVGHRKYMIVTGKR